MSCVKHRRNVSVDLEQTVDPNFQDKILPACVYLTFYFSKSNLRIVVFKKKKKQVYTLN